MRRNKMWRMSIGFAMACALMLNACSSGNVDSSTSDPGSTGEISGSVDADSTADTESADVVPGVQVEKEDVYILERPEGLTEDTVSYPASEAALAGNCKLNSDSDGDFIEGFQDDGDTCTFTIEITADYFYDLNIRAKSTGGEKTNNLLVDGEAIGSFTTSDGGIQDGIVQRVFLAQGTHEITVSKSWGWIKVYSLELTASAALDPDMYEVSAKLINPNATDNTKRLMSYLTDIYGRYILSGQQCDAGKEIFAISKETGRRSAVIGLDLIEYSPSRAENGSTSNAVENAIDYYNESGGIVTMCWHWNAPTKYLKLTDAEPWYRGFYTTATNINLASIMSGKDEEGYELLVSDIDAIAEQLKRIQDADVPLIWRPLHEASGGWFWWGASGPDAYKELWKLMYDRLTNYHGINNLIWLWNGQDADWYPGDEYVDIIGEDIYPGERVSTSQASKYFEANAYTSAKKMVVLSENGCIPDPDLCIRDGAMWGYFCTWGGEFALKGNLANYSDQYTTKEILDKAYNHEKVITLDELPDLKNYVIHED